jgi:hypothetical protein
MRLCVLLRSAKLKAIGNNKLTIRTFLFSLPLSAQAHACTASFCDFFLRVVISGAFINFLLHNHSVNIK